MKFAIYLKTESRKFIILLKTYKVFNFLRLFYPGIEVYYLFFLLKTQIVHWKNCNFLTKIFVDRPLPWAKFNSSTCLNIFFHFKHESIKYFTIYRNDPTQNWSNPGISRMYAYIRQFSGWCIWGSTKIWPVHTRGSAVYADLWLLPGFKRRFQFDAVGLEKHPVAK